MMLLHASCVLLAPAMVYAAAFPWALPEPTRVAPAPDNWSPAPTAAAQLPGFELFRRQTAEGGYTCGYVSGLSQSSFTCSNTNFVCATNTLHGVHGCCDPRTLDSCTIPTTCIASTAMSTLCPGGTCSSDPYILRCSEAALPECYKWMISYGSTVMTQHGCASRGFTSTAQRSYGQSSIANELYRTETVTVVSTPSSTPTLTPVSSSSKPNLGAIVGGTVGGCTIISLVLLAIFLLHRRRKAARQIGQLPPIAGYHSASGTFTTELDPHGFTALTYPNDAKTWQQQNAGPVTRASDAMPHYPGMGAGQYGIVEVDGMQRPVEAPAENVYHAREYMRS